MPQQQVVLHRALRHRVLERLAADRLALQLPRFEQVRAMVLARGVVVDDPDRALAVEVEGEVIGHRAGAAGDRLGLDRPRRLLEAVALSVHAGRGRQPLALRAR